MHHLTVIIVLGSALCAHAKDWMANGIAQRSASNLDEDLAERMLDRTFKSLPLNHASLDRTTLKKSGHLAGSSRTTTRPLLPVADLALRAQPRITVGASANERFAANIDEFKERLNSGKAALLGTISGGVGVTIPAYAVNVLNGRGLPQWEFDTDMDSLQGALFAVVYRYAVREDGNPMLKMGCVGAFVLTKALTSVRVSDGCAAIPLRCGDPLGYFDWAMLEQLAGGTATSVALFGSVALALEYACDKGWVGRFPSLPRQVNVTESSMLTF